MLLNQRKNFFMERMTLKQASVVERYKLNQKPVSGLKAVHPLLVGIEEPEGRRLVDLFPDLKFGELKVHFPDPGVVGVVAEVVPKALVEDGEFSIPRVFPDFGVAAALLHSLIKIRVSIMLKRAFWSVFQAKKFSRTRHSLPAPRTRSDPEAPVETSLKNDDGLLAGGGLGRSSLPFSRSRTSRARSLLWARRLAGRDHSRRHNPLERVRPHPRVCVPILRDPRAQRESGPVTIGSAPTTEGPVSVLSELEPLRLRILLADVL